MTTFKQRGTSALDAHRHSLLSLLFGISTLCMGFASMFAASKLRNDDFHVFFAMFIGASIVALPLAVATVIIGAYAIRRDRRFFLPLLSVGLSSIGVGLIVWLLAN